MTLPDLHTDYLSTISAVLIVFTLLILFLGLLDLSKALIIVLVTLSVFYVTDHHYDRKTESEIEIHSIATGTKAESRDI